MERIYFNENKSRADLLNMFKTCYGLHKNTNYLGTKGYVFYVGTNPRSEHFYVCFPETGEIGSGDKWMFVPDKLRIFLQQFIISKHLPLHTYPNQSDAVSHTIDASKPNKTINKPTKTDIEILHSHSLGQWLRVDNIIEIKPPKPL